MVLIATLTALFVALFNQVGGFENVTWHNAPPPHSSPVGLTLCYGDTAEVWVRPDTPIQVSVHEMAHVLDCFDDGVLNSSPFVVLNSIFCGPCNTEIERFAAWVHQHPDAALRALPNWARLRSLAGLESLR